MKTMIVLLASLIGVAGCLNGDIVADAQPVKAEQPLEAPAATTSTDESCRFFMQRQRACSEAFVPALVDARVKADNPSGLAETETKIGREALVKQAFDEWANDSKDPAINALCDEIAQRITPTNDTELRASLSRCLALEGCGAFVSCAVPLSLRRWKE